jgi:hypothetical protein
VGEVAGAVVRQGSRTDVVVFSANPNGGPLDRAAVDVNIPNRTGDLTIVTLTPGARYSVRIGGSGRVQRIAIASAPGGDVTADAAGVARIRLDSIARAGGIGMASGASGGSISGAGGGTVAAAEAGELAFGPAAGGEGAGSGGAGHVHPGLLPATADDAASIAEWDARVRRMLRSGELRVRETMPDAAVKGRTHQRLVQHYKSVPVFGGDLTRSLDGQRTVAVVGALYQGVDLDPAPTLTTEEAAAVFEQFSPGASTPIPTPELMILPTDDGGYALTYRARIPTGTDVQMVFVDANTGEVVLAFSDLRRPAR